MHQLVQNVMVRDTIREAIGLSDTDDAPRTPDVPLPPDEVLDLLHSRRRRIAIRVAATLDDGEHIEQSNFAREIAAIEGGCDPNDVPKGEFKSVYSALLQHHFEQLEAAGVISRGRRTTGVSRGPNAGDVAHLLSVLEAHCDDYEEPE